jgi:predicted ribosome quality control (RQC) complex YloA/Tae2 family protein
MGNEKEMPPKQVLLEAASYAAFNSKAKGMKLAPVIITKKKYVRKPKGSPPGAVVVDKEEVEMVTPKKPNS